MGAVTVIIMDQYSFDESNKDIRSGLLIQQDNRMVSIDSGEERIASTMIGRVLSKPIAVERGFGLRVCATRLAVVPSGI